MDGDGLEPKLIAEAILFAADRPVELKVLQNAMGIRSPNKAKAILEELKAEYASQRRAIEIIELRGGRFFMRLRPDLLELARRYTRRQVLTSGVLKTLAFVAYHQPVQRSTVVAVRGKDAYRQLKILLDRGFIETEKSGRTQLLRTTQLFADLFGVENTPSAIKGVISRLLKAEAQQQPTRGEAVEEAPKEEQKQATGT